MWLLLIDFPLGWDLGEEESQKKSRSRPGASGSYLQADAGQKGGGREGSASAIFNLPAFFLSARFTSIFIVPANSIYKTLFPIQKFPKKGPTPPKKRACESGTCYFSTFSRTLST